MKQITLFRLHPPLLTLLVFIISITNTVGQTVENETIEVANFKTIVNSDGSLFWDLGSSGTFLVPNNGINDAHTFFAANLWIGGLDSSGQLHMSAQTYRQTGTDFWPGPLDTTSGASNDSLYLLYGGVHNISKSEVDSLKAGYSPSQNILDYPGNGSLNASSQLAPYKDTDQNGIYDPYNGDYPIVKGDEMLWWVYNDNHQDSSHSESEGLPLGVEIKATLYGYNCENNEDAFNTLFLHYEITNRSSNNYKNAYIGFWSDMDIGYYKDDFVGSLVDLNSYYSYNGDSLDDLPSGYGNFPPAQSVTFLKGPLADANDSTDNDRDNIIDEADEELGMSHFVYYNNDFSSTGNPEESSDYYGYLKGEWKDSTHITYDGNGKGGGIECDYMFPGNSDPNGYGTGGVSQPEWSEYTAGNTPDDRRGLGSMGPFTFEAGEKVTIEFALVFAQDSTENPNSSVPLLKNRIASVMSLYNADSLTSCYDSLPTSITTKSIDNIAIDYYLHNKTVIISSNTTINSLNIFDISGRQVHTLTKIGKANFTYSLNFLKAGNYIIEVNTTKSMTYKQISIIKD